MTAYKRGDVVLVPFPFSDQTTAKKRPAVIISSSPYNETSGDLVILAVTSRVGKSTEVGAFLIEEWQEAGLLKPSAVKPAISTIEQTLILKRLGSLSAKDLMSMNRMLKELLGLS